MQTRNRNIFTTIHTEGALLPVDLLQRIRDNDSSLEGLDAQSYHLAPGEKINEAINRSWNRLNGLWGAFQTARGRLGSTDPGTTLTRERWLLPLFQELGFGRLSTAKAVEIEGKSYPLSHRWQNIPLHLVGCGLELDKRTPGAAGAARVSPHSLLQEYLNRSDDAQWGVVSNGLSLRVLRDNATLTRQAYVEFDLESMFDGEVYSDFVLLWLVCHQSRFETTEKQTDCILEHWSKSAQERGTRALDDLRNGVEGAIVSLGQGFLQNPLNGVLRTRLKKGDLSAQDYYRQLLRLVYRLIFLFAAEDRELLLLPDAPVEARQRFQNYYSTTHLRILAERQRGSRHHDRYEGLRLVFQLLSGEEFHRQGGKDAKEAFDKENLASLRFNLALPALGGFLFDSHSTADLDRAKLDNQSLLAAVRSLAFIAEANIRRAVDYRNLGPEELGSVYESLLELDPLLNVDAGTFQLTSVAGNERKTTGSYYTPTSLIQVLLDSALDPVIEQALENSARKDAEIFKQNMNSSANTVSPRETALLNLKVCDPACGSGHFLIAAAHRIAARLAQVRSGGEEPSPDETRRALRDVIQHCIYGVDINPMAVELCKVNLWLELLEPGKPLSFLDAHIKCGNSLVGVGPKMELNGLEIPDEAFNPVTGDDRTIAASAKKRNKIERSGQLSFELSVGSRDFSSWISGAEQEILGLPQDTVEQVNFVANHYEQFRNTQEFSEGKLEYDLWAAAFFWKLAKDPYDAYNQLPTQGMLENVRQGKRIPIILGQKIQNLVEQVGFFHWSLEFPEVFLTNGESGTANSEPLNGRHSPMASLGFDCILGNPPWERIKLQEEEFFAAWDPEIVAAPNKAARERLIKKLNETNPLLANKYEDAKHSAECTSKFVRSSNRYLLTAVGDVNTYALFAEHARDLTGTSGRAGIIVPTGIATDDTTKDFFGDLVEKRSIASLFDFENREKLFPAVDSRMKFCLLTLSGVPVSQAQFVFFATRVEHLRDERRRFILDLAEIALFNPNTRTMPVFRTRMDAELTRKIYNKVPVLVNIKTGENTWNISFLRMFDASLDSDLFVVSQYFEKEGFYRNGNRYIKENQEFIQLQEGRLGHQYNHRYASQANGKLVDSTIIELQDPDFIVETQYFVNKENVIQRLNNREIKCHTDFLAHRRVSRNTDERTAIATILPWSAVSNSWILTLGPKSSDLCLLCANYNSLIYDYTLRNQLSQPSIPQSTSQQIPILPPSTYHSADIAYITWHVLELIYTAYDLKPFAEDMGYHGEPFRWDEERRALLRAELDAYYARLYGLTRDELRYILDPQDVYGPDFPGETFRVLKDKEIRQFGEYRTRRMVLEAWNRLEASGELPEPAYERTASPIPQRESITLTSEPAKPALSPKREEPPVQPAPQPKAKAAPEGQPTLSDFGLYKCEFCGKLVMGYEKEKHEQEVHGGKSVEWKKVK